MNPTTETNVQRIDRLTAAAMEGWKKQRRGRNAAVHTLLNTQIRKLVEQGESDGDIAGAIAGAILSLQRALRSRQPLPESL